MPKPQVKSGIIQGVTPYCVNTMYETDGDGTETKGGDIRKALEDVDSPQAITTTLGAAYDGDSAFGVMASDAALDG